MEIEEFRKSFINEDINAEALSTNRYPIEVFIDQTVDILKNDYSLISDMNQCFYEIKNGNRAYKSMHIDAAYLDLPGNVLNLLVADYNEEEIKTITNTIINDRAQTMLNYFENCLKGFFRGAEQANPAVQLANEIIRNIELIHTIHLFYVSTDKLSNAVKTLELDDFKFGSFSFCVVLDVLDIDKIFKSKMAGFEKEDLIINCKDYGIEGLPCIKADIETDQYDSYLAIVPGVFLAEIYKKYSSSLLESNVRSFLKFNGGVNKGIRGTILNEKSRFFTYNNGISTTAKDVQLSLSETKGLLITSLTNLQIINGGQTTATLAATNIKNNADLSGIFVQMKLTVLKNEDPELIRNIATYANSQNKVKTADLNSSHPFYVRMEEFSRKTYAPPIEAGQIVQQMWFFERARGQYEQPLMQMTTKKERDTYKNARPKNMKFTLSDLAKYINCAEMMPYSVAWGGEVNAAHFHNNMVKQWTKDDKVYNEFYYKELIGKKILFSFIENVISDQEWYQERRAYRPQLVAYTFSKFVFEARRIQKYINFKNIWDLRAAPECFYKDIANIGKIVFDTIYDDNRSTSNIETYCKKEECWLIVQKKLYNISDKTRNELISYSDIIEEKTQAKKNQKQTNELKNEVEIYTKGSDYWESMIRRGRDQKILNEWEIAQLNKAVQHCISYSKLWDSEIRAINNIAKKLNDNGII